MDFETLRSLIVEITNCTEEEVQENTSLKDDLGMDSLDAMELVMLIEEKTGLTIPESKLPDFNTVKDIADYINAA